MRIFVSFAVILLLLSSPLEAATQQTQGDPVAAASSVNAFALDAYGLLSREKGNLFFSPYSISTALAMTYAGAKGDTAKEISQALHFKPLQNNLHPSFRALRQRLNSFPKDFGVMATANRLWLDKQEKLRDSYTTLIAEYYQGGVEKLDFRNDSEAARKAINSWVEEKTHDRIRNLLHDGDVGASTRLVLTNVIYFKSAWTTPFDKQQTKPQPFRLNAKERRDVETMFREGEFLYSEVDGVQLLKVPYNLSGLSMLLLLPRVSVNFDQMEQLEKKLASSGAANKVLAAWVKTMRPRQVQVWLPKFKDEGRFMLKDLLKSLGMKKAFGSSADFSGMVKDKSLYIDSVIHQTFIELDEGGTEAAAATAVAIARATMRIPVETKTTEFRADHPFVYFITDDESGAVLFMGRMSDPQF